MGMEGWRPWNLVTTKLSQDLSISLNVPDVCFEPPAMALMCLCFCPRRVLTFPHDACLQSRALACHLT